MRRANTLETLHGCILPKQDKINDAAILCMEIPSATVIHL